MLLDIVLAVAPVVVAVPALVALLTTHVGYASKGHLQKRLYGSLLLAEKLPAGTPGARQIATISTGKPGTSPISCSTRIGRRRSSTSR